MHALAMHARLRRSPDAPEDPAERGAMHDQQEDMHDQSGSLGKSDPRVREALAAEHSAKRAATAAELR